MDTKVANNIIVGIFVSLAMIGFVWVLFNIGGGSGFLSGQYSIYGKFSNVKGLHAGSEVSLAGLHIGVVKAITVSNEDSRDLIVQFAINRKWQDRIRDDSIATIRTQGVLGDKFVEISIGSKGDALQNGAFMPTQEPADLFTKGGTLVEDVEKHFQRGSDFDALMKNLTVVTQNLAVLSTEVREQKGLLHELIYGTGGKSLNSSLTHVDNILGKIDRGEGTIGSLINDPTVYEDLKYMMGGAKRSTVLRYFMRQFIESGEKAPPNKKE